MSSEHHQEAIVTRWEHLGEDLRQSYIDRLSVQVETTILEEFANRIVKFCTSNPLPMLLGN